MTSYNWSYDAVKFRYCPIVWLPNGNFRQYPKERSTQCSLTVFASPRHPESGFDGCRHGTHVEIDISKMAAKMAATFINDHISVTMPPRTMVLVARYMFVGSINPIFLTTLSVIHGEIEISRYIRFLYENPLYHLKLLNNWIP